MCKERSLESQYSSSRHTPFQQKTRAIQLLFNELAISSTCTKKNFFCTNYLYKTFNFFLSTLYRVANLNTYKNDIWMVRTVPYFEWIITFLTNYAKQNLAFTITRQFISLFSVLKYLYKNRTAVNQRNIVM